MAFPCTVGARRKLVGACAGCEGPMGATDHGRRGSRWAAILIKLGEKKEEALRAFQQVVRRHGELASPDAPARARVEVTRQLHEIVP